MSEWVKPHAWFERREVRLVATRQEWYSRPNLPDIFELLRDPASAEVVLRDVIAESRPDLSGGVLVGVRYDQPTACVELYYLHPSALKVAEGEPVPRERLFQREG